MPFGGDAHEGHGAAEGRSEGYGIKILLGATLAEAHMPMIKGTATAVVPVLKAQWTSRRQRSWRRATAFFISPLGQLQSHLTDPIGKTVTNVDSPMMNMAMNRALTVLSPK